MLGIKVNKKIYIYQQTALVLVCVYKCNSFFNLGLLQIINMNGSNKDTTKLLYK